MGTIATSTHTLATIWYQPIPLDALDNEQRISIALGEPKAASLVAQLLSQGKMRYMGAVLPEEQGAEDDILEWVFDHCNTSEQWERHPMCVGAVVALTSQQGIRRFYCAPIGWVQLPE